MLYDVPAPAVVTVTVTALCPRRKAREAESGAEGGAGCSVRPRLASRVRRATRTCSGRSRVVPTSATWSRSARGRDAAARDGGGADRAEHPGEPRREASDGACRSRERSRDEWGTALLGRAARPGSSTRARGPRASPALRHPRGCSALPSRRSVPRPGSGPSVPASVAPSPVPPAAPSWPVGAPPSSVGAGPAARADGGAPGLPGEGSPTGDAAQPARRRATSTTAAAGLVAGRAPVRLPTCPHLPGGAVLRRPVVSAPAIAAGVLRTNVDQYAPR